VSARPRQTGDDGALHARRHEHDPAAIGTLAFANKAVVYDLLFKKAAETLITIAADLKHPGARIGLTAVLHTWGSALTHHPHVHIIVPGGGLSPGGSRWIACKPGFFLPVRVLSRLFRRLFLEGLTALKQAGELASREISRGSPTKASSTPRWARSAQDHDARRRRVHPAPFAGFTFSPTCTTLPHIITADLASGTPLSHPCAPMSIGASVIVCSPA
jgi:hypothetical protein